VTNTAVAKGAGLGAVPQGKHRPIAAPVDVQSKSSQEPCYVRFGSLADMFGCLKKRPP